jgi:hypothetical protein
MPKLGAICYYRCDWCRIAVQAFDLELPDGWALINVHGYVVSSPNREITSSGKGRDYFACPVCDEELLSSLNLQVRNALIASH